MTNGIDKIYEDFEDVKMHYVGFITNDVRYDFALTYTNLFFGKTLITCMQTGRSTLVDGNDMEDSEQFCRIFNYCDKDQFTAVSDFLKTKIPVSYLADQY